MGNKKNFKVAVKQRAKRGKRGSSEFILGQVLSKVTLRILLVHKPISSHLKAKFTYY